VRNRSWKSRIKTARRKLEEAIEKNKADTMETLFREYESVVDKAVSKGVLHKNTASRRKTVMAQRMKRAGEAPQQPKKAVKSSKKKPAKAAESDTAQKEKNAATEEKDDSASEDASSEASDDASPGEAS
jgi:small subunit ribosomal protein S20